MTLTDDKIRELREIAENATPGPWIQNGTGTIVCDLSEDCLWTVIAPNGGNRNSEESRQKDFDFIATFSPSTVLSLLDELEKMRKEMRDGRKMALRKEVGLMDLNTGVVLPPIFSGLEDRPGFSYKNMKFTHQGILILVKTLEEK